MSQESRLFSSDGEDDPGSESDQTKTTRTRRAPAKASDIRAVFAVNLTAVDESELRAAFLSLDAALSQLKTLQLETDSLKLKLRESERLLSLGLNAPQPIKSKLRFRSAFLFHKTSVRCGASFPDSPFLYIAHGVGPVAQGMTQGSLSEFGVTRFNIDNRIQPRTFMPLHTAAIRDFKLRSNGVGSTAKPCLLSTGMDKKLNLFSYERDSIELSITLPTAGWSCAFDTVRPNILYAGGASNSIIHIYDIRKPSEILKSLSHPDMGKLGFGVHSLHHIESTDALVG
ncbi:RING finger and WD repeat domain-containing protein 3, partial [Podochytrium sp. JEL0797]